ncbi:hypothetical protein [Streptomyces aureus]
MAITVIRELDESPSDGLGQGEMLSVKAVHAVPDDTDGHPGEETLCGKPTADMERLRYQPASADTSWLPPGMIPLKCRWCTDALQPLYASDPH